MKLNINCILQKKVSKTGKEFYVLYLEDIAKYVFLSETELKLVKLLYSTSDNAE